MPVTYTKTLFSVAGFAASITASLLLAVLWVHWSRSAWADCPNYAFSLPWFPEPPLLVVALPSILAILGIVCFAVRLFVTERLPPVGRRVCVAGLTLSCLPLVAAVLRPTASDLLHLTRSGC